MNPLDGPDRENYVKQRLEEARKMADDLREQRAKQADDSAHVGKSIIGVSGQNGPMQSLDLM